MERNNNSNKNIKLQIKSFLKKISFQLYFKRVNVHTVCKARWCNVILSRNRLCHVSVHSGAERCFLPKTPKTQS